METFRTIIVRALLVLFVAGIFAYIFWPQSSNSEDTTTTTLANQTTTSLVQDTPCVVLFAPDTANYLVNDNVCLNNYAQKYLQSVYTSLKVECRASSDGANVNRQILSDSRTKTVKLSLIDFGVSVNDIETLSYGDSNPVSGIDPNSNEGKLINRSCVVSGIK